MSWLFSRALVEASSAVISSDGALYAPSSAMPTPQVLGDGSNDHPCISMGTRALSESGDGRRPSSVVNPNQERRERVGACGARRLEPADSSTDATDSLREGLQGQREFAGGTGETLHDAGDIRWWEVEPDVGRVADGVAARVDRLACLGNGQVPAVASLAWRRLAGVGFPP